MNEIDLNEIDNNELEKDFLISNIRNTEPRHILKNPIYQRIHEIILESGNCIEHFSLTYPINQITYNMKPNTDIIINTTLFGSNYMVEDITVKNIEIILNDGGITILYDTCSLFVATDEINNFEIHTGSLKANYDNKGLLE